MFISPLYKFERSSENIDDLLSLQVSINEVIAQDGANIMLADKVLLPLLVIASNIEHQGDTIGDCFNAGVFDEVDDTFGELI